MKAYEGLGLALIFWGIFSWFTHVIACIMTGKWALLIAGAILFPIGCIHGTGIWFGFWS